MYTVYILKIFIDYVIISQRKLNTCKCSITFYNNKYYNEMQIHKLKAGFTQKSYQ